MAVLKTAGILISLAAAGSYVNHRWLKLPGSIALMAMAMVASLGLLAAGWLPGDAGGAVVDWAHSFAGSIDFPAALMQGMLGLLLFAGALHVNLGDLLEHKWQIGSFATIAVVASTFLVGAIVWCLCAALGMQMPWIYCFLFGALISPTDPIAVLGIMKKAGASKSLETKISGESLFNDGIGVVVFLSLLSIAAGSHATGPGEIAAMFAVEVVGGIVYGFIIGYGAYRLLKSIDNYQVEILITLALVMGGYSLAGEISIFGYHVSGPLAMVVAGLMIGNTGRRLAMSDRTREHLDMFWELIDEVLNAVLFVLIGIEVLVLTLQGRYLLAGALAVPIVLFARFVTVGAMTVLTDRGAKRLGRTVTILTWGGLRGGISVALALSLPEGEYRELIVTMTYVVVAFSVLVQGLSVGKLIRMNPVKG